MPVQSPAPSPSFEPPVPPAPPTPPSLPGGGGSGGRIVLQGGTSSPQAVYAAAKARGEELSRQLDRLEDRRGELSQRLRETGDEVDRKGLQQQLNDVDGRITSLNQQIAVSDQQIAQAAGIPGAIPPETPPPPRNGPPDEVFIIPIVFTIFVLFPLAIAYARRIWRRSSVGPATIPPELAERMERIEHAVESVAEEVERIGEGQRFVTKLFAEPGLRPQVEAPR